MESAPWTAARRPDGRLEEQDYNRYVGDKIEGFVCLDRRLVRTPAHRRGFEACDLLGPDDELVHVEGSARVPGRDRSAACSPKASSRSTASPTGKPGTACRSRPPTASRPRGPARPPPPHARVRHAPQRRPAHSRPLIHLRALRTRLGRGSLPPARRAPADLRVIRDPAAADSTGESGPGIGSEGIASANSSAAAPAVRSVGPPEGVPISPARTRSPHRERAPSQPPRAARTLHEAVGAAGLGDNVAG